MSPIYLQSRSIMKEQIHSAIFDKKCKKIFWDQKGGTHYKWQRGFSASSECLFPLRHARTWVSVQTPLHLSKLATASNRNVSERQEREPKWLLWESKSTRSIPSTHAERREATPESYSKYASMHTHAHMQRTCARTCTHTQAHTHTYRHTRTHINND